MTVQAWQDSGYMKAIITLVMFAIALPLFASGSTNDVVAIVASVKDAKEVRTTSTGYSVTTSSGTRNVYKTSTGYYVEGGGGDPSREIIKTAAGYRIESSATRGSAFSNRK